MKINKSIYIGVACIVSALFLLVVYHKTTPACKIGCW